MISPNPHLTKEMSKTFKKSTALCSLYGFFLIIATVMLVFFIRQGNWLQTDLTALLPEEQSWNEIQLAADKQQENQLNRQVVALIGHNQAEIAFQSAQKTALQWQNSNLFESVIVQTQPDITKLRQTITQLSLALLPSSVRQQLIDNPEQYFQHYAEQIVNPFNQTNLLSPDQDWLGFGRFVLSQSNLSPTVRWNADNGMLYLKHHDKTWVLLRAVMPEANLISPSFHLSELIQQSRQTLQQDGSDILITGAALFAATAKQQAERESTLMSCLGVGLTLLLLLSLFRTFRVLWLFLPVCAGMLFGVVATVIWFGKIHILTLVIGTSLIGVLIDFPLHWLTASLFNPQWQAEKAMKQLRFTFIISLLVTLLGYGLLGFTSLPVLKQTALFSATALIGAILCTLLFLPVLFRRYSSSHKLNFSWLLSFGLPKSVEKLLVLLFAFFVCIGLYKSQWKDDIRQWVAMPPSMLNEAAEIGKLTGIDLGSQYFLIVAKNDNELLALDKKLSSQLMQLQSDKKLTGFQSLSQWISSEQEQQQFVRQFTEKLKPSDYAVLQEIGEPAQFVENALAQLKETPPVSLQQALQSELGQARRTLYLGQLASDKVVGLIKVSGVQNQSAVENLADFKQIYWQDKRANLNLAFQQTRDQAGWLKIISFLLAGLLLWKFFGLRNTAKMLLIPLFAIVSTVAVFGWLALPISLFTMFGLLLVSAIAIDYTAYMYTVQEPLVTKRTAVLSACATTMISFVLLGFSSTPAVSSFGLSVAIGVLFSVIATFRILR